MDNLITENPKVLKFLQEHFIMSIAVSLNNKPSSSILLYYVDSDFNFYFATHSDSFKAKILLQNPLISLSIWEHNQMLIQADGKATEITDDSQRIEIMDKLAESASKDKNFWPPLFRIQGKGYSVFKIKPTWLRKLDLEQDTISQVGSPFIDIIK